MFKLFSTIIFLLISLSAFAEQSQPIQDSTLKTNNELISQSGCCSHHGGVCGCNGGRAVCCDGEYSPSCGCHADNIKDFLKTNEIEQTKS